MPLEEKLQIFASNHNFLGNKGPLCVALVMTAVAGTNGLPLNPENLLTPKGGQVRGLSSGAVQKILAKYEIDRVLAREAGRTSRGSIDNMRAYVAFLNDLGTGPDFDLDLVEAWWVSKVREYFDSSPLTLKVDPSSSLKTCFRTVFDEATERQAESPGSTVVGAILQHLVGAKLEKLYPENNFDHHGYSVADAPTKRSGDFEFGDSTIHVTTSPGNNLIDKCQENINQGLRPIIISTMKGAGFAEELARNAGIEKRIEVLDIEQFLVANMIEWTRFDGKDRRGELQDLIDRYNVIVESCETDPSLKVVLA